MNNEILIFDRSLKKLHRDRSCNAINKADFLVKESANNIIERLEDITAKFPTMLDCGCRNGLSNSILEDKFGIETIVRGDLSYKILEMMEENRVQLDEEILPFADDSFDLIVSILNMHWINDLPGSLVQLYRALKEKGVFIASLLGGETLIELKEATMQAAIEENRGISPRFSPLVAIKDAAHLLQRAGFHLPVADSIKITVMYKDVISLIKDLRSMGETNALIKRDKKFMTRTMLADINKKYFERFSNKEGNIPATFEIITITGWKS